MPGNSLYDGVGLVENEFDPVSGFDALEAGLSQESLPYRMIRDVMENDVKPAAVERTRSHFGRQKRTEEIIPEGWNPLEDDRVRDNLPLHQYVFDAESPSELNERLEEIRRSQADQAVLAEADPSTRFLAMTAGSLFNFDMLVPLGFVGSGLSRAAKAAGAALAVGAPQELLLQAGDPLRSDMTAGLNVLSITAASAGLSALNVGRRATAMGKRTKARTFRKGSFMEDETGAMPFGGSTVGAAQNPAFTRTLEEEGMVATGTGVENIPLNPILRLLKSQSREARVAVEDLADMGGIVKNKNKAGEATSRSVETEFRVNYAKDLFDAIDLQNDAFLRMRGKPRSTPGRRVVGAQLTRLQDRLKTPEQMTLKQFREEVGRALKNGDQHAVPEVAETAKGYRKLFDRLGKEAEEAGLFERALRRDINGLRKQIDDLGQQAPTSHAEIAALNRRKANLENRLSRLLTHGPDLNSAPSYFHRMYRVDRIHADPEGFIRDVVDGMLDRDPTMRLVTARKAAEEVQRKILGHRPHLDLDDINRKGAGDASAARARLLEVDDKFLDRWVENDAEIVLRSYVKSIGTDIWLQNKFGDISLAPTINKVAQEYDDLIAKAASPDEARIMQLERDRTISDIENLRDVVRGTFGASNDPFSPITRFTKLMKTFNVVTMMGGAAISSLTDIGRLAMTEGFEQGYGPLLRTLASQNRKTMARMSRRELNAAGEALDMVLGLRAMQMVDIGNAFGTLSQFERALQEGSNVFFLMNGLNMWNTAVKEWAGIVISDRIIRDCMKWADGTLTDAARTKLTRSGIDEATARTIAEETRRVGVQENKVWMPNTALWENADEAVASFRGALSQDVNRTIITPGAGDKAFWTSTEFGSLIAQFKSFGQASVNRTIVSGLQEKQANFYTGAAMMVGLAFGVNEIKRTLRGDDRSEGFGEKLSNAIDRSGILGVFQDANNAVEVLSGHKLGLGPVIGGARAYGSTASEVAGLAGPTGSTLNRLGAVLGDVGTRRSNKYTASNAFRLLPGSNLPYIEPLRQEVMGALSGKEPGGRE